MERYSRQQLFSPIGEKGQEALRSKHVLIVGLGALGSSLSEMMVRAGVGKLTIIDRDYVEASNLQRQQLYVEEDANNRWPKAIAAEKRLHAINHEVDINAIVGDADVERLEELMVGVDLILDGTDNFETRFLLNDFAQKYRIPWIFGSCVGSFGMSYTMVPGKTPCFQCLLKRVPMNGVTCDTNGVIGPIVQMVTAHQGAEALKILTNNEESVRHTFVSFDLWQNEYIQIKTAAIKDDGCLSCGESATFPMLKREEGMRTAILCGRDTVQIRPSQGKQKLNLQDLAFKWQKGGMDVSGNPFLLSIKKDDHRMVLFEDGRALIHGTADPMKAKIWYQSLLG
jgi:molybdopterin/thiamine biosynthesis adenylyltransferase